MCMSPTLNGSSEILCFERSDAIEISNGINVLFLPETAILYITNQHFLVS